MIGIARRPDNVSVLIGHNGKCAVLRLADGSPPQSGNNRILMPHARNRYSLSPGCMPPARVWFLTDQAPLLVIPRNEDVLLRCLICAALSSRGTRDSAFPLVDL